MTDTIVMAIESADRMKKGAFSRMILPVFDFKKEISRPAGVAEALPTSESSRAAFPNRFRGQ